MKIGIIGEGAIGRYVRDSLLERGHVIRAILKRRERLQDHATERDGTLYVASVGDLPDDIEHMIDCAGHMALKSYGPDILRRGTDLTTVSIGALADPDLHQELEKAETQGHARLHLASGAIGALAGLGFDKTQVKLIADPGISENIHEIQACGDFGRFWLDRSAASCEADHELPQRGIR